MCLGIWVFLQEVEWYRIIMKNKGGARTVAMAMVQTCSVSCR